MDVANTHRVRRAVWASLREGLYVVAVCSFVRLFWQVGQHTVLWSDTALSRLEHGQEPSWLGRYIVATIQSVERIDWAIFGTVVFFLVVQTLALLVAELRLFTRADRYRAALHNYGDLAMLFTLVLFCALCIAW